MRRILLLCMTLLCVSLLTNAQDYTKCVMIETTQGETFEYYLSSNPRLTQNNDKVTLSTDATTIEFTTQNLKKLYLSEGNYKLVYMLDGIVYKTYYHHEGVTIPQEPAPTKEGYKFSGWNNEPNIMPDHDIVVTGTFSLMTFKLTYMVDDEIYKTYNIEYGATITPEPIPVKEGHTFSGWSAIPETMPAEDVTVTGSFAINKYNLIYKVDGEIYKTIETEYGTTIIPLEAPQKDGYTFSGWSEIPTVMPAHDVIVTGSFTIGQYTLTYIVDGETYKVFSYDYGTVITPEPAPTKEGYTFSGWSVIPETMPAQDVKVYGSFTINRYRLTYVVDGEEYKRFYIDYGADITPEPNPTKEGYTFSGWSWIPTKMPAEDVTITGTFKANKYKVNYYVDNNPYYTDMVEFGATITPPVVQEREGYDFAWGYIPDTMPAYDISIYGLFTIKTGINNVSIRSGGNNNGQDYFHLSGLQPNEGVSVFSISGERIMSCQASAEGELTISLASLIQGVYIIKTSRQTIKVTRK